MSKTVATKKYDYTAVNLPHELLNEVDKFIENKTRYRSRAEFVKKAIENQLWIDAAHKGIWVVDNEGKITKYKEGSFEQMIKGSYSTSKLMDIETILINIEKQLNKKQE